MNSPATRAWHRPLKKYRIEIKPTAENDLITRYQQIAEDSPQNALNWYLQTIEAIEKLDILAERCPIAPEDLDIKMGIRHLIIGDYRVLYLINGDLVEVLHVRHGSKRRKLYQQLGKASKNRAGLYQPNALGHFREV